jgi:hypothetical protein
MSKPMSPWGPSPPVPLEPVPTVGFTGHFLPRVWMHLNLHSLYSCASQHHKEIYGRAYGGVLAEDREVAILESRDLDENTIMDLDGDGFGRMPKTDMYPAVSSRQHFDWALCESVAMLRRVA